MARVRNGLGIVIIVICVGFSNMTTAKAVEITRPTSITLIKNGKAQAIIVANPVPGSVESVAVSNFTATIERIGQAKIYAKKEADKGTGAIVFIGTVRSNPALAKVAKELKLPLEDIAPEGFLIRTTKIGSRACLIITAKDARGILYGVQEALNQVITSTTDNEIIAVKTDITRAPAVAKRGTYCLTCWPPATTYSRQAWEQAIDSMACAGMNRVMFWTDGLFRSKRYPDAFLAKGHYAGAKLTHDDINYLIEYAHERGMDFLLGTGVFGWFTAIDFAEKNKDAADSGGEILCPSNQKAQQFTLDYISEMHDVFPKADGYMLEIRDEYGDCFCDKCQRPVDEFGSKQFGQSELDLLENLTASVWSRHAKAKFVWLMGYPNHSSDRLYYKRLSEISKDDRIEWLNVRGASVLPGADGSPKPLKYFSSRINNWNPYYRLAPKAIQKGAQISVEQGLCGYLPAYEPGFDSCSVYDNKWQIKNSRFPVELLPFVLTQVLYREYTWDPYITEERLKERIHRQFFGAELDMRWVDNLFFLRQFNHNHYPELTCKSAGFFDTDSLAEATQQITSNTYEIWATKEPLKMLAERIRDLQVLAKGQGGMVRIRQIKERLATERPLASRRSAESLDIIARAISDIERALENRKDDIARAEQILEEIERLIKENVKNKP